jgi:RimJ/RimL family protein N-acetyltransferase
VLRRHEPRDGPRMVEACNDPATARWLGQIPQPFALADAEEFMEGLEERHATGTAVTWAVADPRSDELVGTVDLFDVRRGRDAEVGYWIHPTGRGRGLGTEACRLALRHAFVAEGDGGLGLERVRAKVVEDNLASRRVLEKSGLVHQGRERRAITVSGGRLADAAIYDVLASELRP